MPRVGDLRVNYKTNPVSEVSMFLDESGKIDSSLNVALRVAFYVPLLLTKRTAAIVVNVVHYIEG